jgi:K+-transporting ATPase KdpF subunit
MKFESAINNEAYMEYIYFISEISALGLLVYLLIALFNPEKF